MLRISRRELISSGLALTASCLVAEHGWASTPDPSVRAMDTTETLAASIAPREQLLFDFGWKTCRTGAIGYANIRITLDVSTQAFDSNKRPAENKVSNMTVLN